MAVDEGRVGEALAGTEHVAPTEQRAGAENAGLVAGRAARRRARLLRQVGPHGLRRVAKPLVVAADGVALVLAMVLAFELRRLVPMVPGWNPNPEASQHLALAVASLPVWLAVFARYNLYTARRISSRLTEVSQVVHALGMGVLLTSGAALLLDLHVSRRWILLCFVFGVVAVQVEREIVRRIFTRLRARGLMLRPVLVVGTNVEALALAAMLQRNRTLGYGVVGFVDDRDPVGPLPDDAPLLGRTADLPEILAATGATGVIVATTAVDMTTSNDLTRQLTDLGVHVELSSSLYDIAAGRLTVRALGHCPVIYVEPVRRGGWRALAKHTFDVCAASAGLAVLAVPLAVIAIAVKLDSSGPVLFRQTRLGKDGRLFRVYKFRTMVPDAEGLLDGLRDASDSGGPLFKRQDDPRVTRVGRFLRSSSLDELPQLWNVLRGEMSLVGPRPALPHESESWSPQLFNRLRVRPGLTGMWQVNGRSRASFEEYVRLDLYYVDNWSLWVDIAIVAKTVPTVLLRRGAY